MQVIDQCYDQGYGSERSPEDEVPPSLPVMGVEHQYNPMIVNSVMMPQGYFDGMSQMLEMDSHQRLHQQAIQQNYDFITEGENEILEENPARQSFRHESKIRDHLV